MKPVINGTKASQDPGIPHAPFHFLLVFGFVIVQNVHRKRYLNLIIKIVLI